MNPQVTERVKRSTNSRRRKRHPRAGDITRVALAIWMIGAYIAVFIAYLKTRDPTVITLWTSCATLAAVVFAHFFKKKA